MKEIDSPAIIDSLEIWKNYLEQLENISTPFEKNTSIITAKKRALRTIHIMENYPDGIDFKNLPMQEKKFLLKIFKD